MDVKGTVLLQLLTKQVKKWDQNLLKAKIFLYLLVKFKKLDFSAPLNVIVCLSQVTGINTKFSLSLGTFVQMSNSCR